MKEKLLVENVQFLNASELSEINGGESGDAAYWIGRSYVWTIAHFATGGVSTVYLLLN
jgi:hypothetical protein